ncbi:Fusaric acid resistance protein-like-domain-containing protein [Lipomyces orientalis]|uniref:Fusaric acid resistance protein-like-domain-containing protein n=1 Tax=Lipomyces orientalis TaxID=1233043 RepID=A0ACC3TF97_9ASCO
MEDGLPLTQRTPTSTIPSRQLTGSSEAIEYSKCVHPSTVSPEPQIRHDYIHNESSTETSADEGEPYSGFGHTLRKHSFRVPSTGSDATSLFEQRIRSGTTFLLDNATGLHDVEAQRGIQRNGSNRDWAVRTGRRRLNVLEWLQVFVRCGLDFLGSPWLTRPLRCSITYFLASLIVFWAPLSRALGPGDTKHLAATATVYFHASRSVGSMIEATLFAEIALLYSACLSVLSMLTARFFDEMDHIVIGHAIVLLVFCAGGLGSIAFLKQSMRIATFNTACSLASVTFASILIHEGSIQRGDVSFSKIIQISVIVNSGIVIATSVCFLIFPYTAIAKLKVTSNKTMKSYTNLLSAMTLNFINGSTLTSNEFDKLLKSSQESMSSLDTLLHESMYEHYVWGTVEEYKFQKRLVKSTQQLSQHIGGLKSSYAMKLRLMDIEPGYRKSSCYELFDVFVHYLGPEMDSLVSTLQNALELLPFHDRRPESSIRVIVGLRDTIITARKTFDDARTSTLQEMYSMDVFRSLVESNSQEICVHLEEIASVCGQFSYGLLNFADGLLQVLIVTEEYAAYLNQGHQRSWHWMKFWERPSQYTMPFKSDESVTVPLPLWRLFSDDTSDLKFVKPAGSVPFGLRLWRALRVFRRNDVKYGIKVGIGAMIFTMPAFIDQSRDIFYHYRGEWGLISFVIVMNISIGSSLSAAFYRILGTVIGTLSAYVTWQLFPSNNIALPIVGFFMAFFCFHMILTGRPNTVFGRFILLTFNLTALYSYSLSRGDDEGDDDEGGSHPMIGEIAWHRLIAVIAGVLWGVIITLYVWPNSARAELKRKLGILWIRLGLVWKSDPLSKVPLLGDNTSQSHYISLEEEQNLAKSYLKMRDLVDEAGKEFRLKGPYPTQQYNVIMSVTEEILDAYHNVNTMIVRSTTTSSELDSDIIRYTVLERKELGNRIFLLFYLLSSALRLGLPLPDHLPNTEHARDRMIAKVNEFRRKQVTEARVGSEDEFVLFYSFILATLSINDALLHIIAMLQQIYGTIEDETLII